VTWRRYGKHCAGSTSRASNTRQSSRQPSAAERAITGSGRALASFATSSPHPPVWNWTRSCFAWLVTTCSRPRPKKQEPLTYGSLLGEFPFQASIIRAPRRFGHPILVACLTDDVDRAHPASVERTWQMERAGVGTLRPCRAKCPCMAGGAGPSRHSGFHEFPFF
jgi:hypothetical protein